MRLMKKIGAMLLCIALLVCVFSSTLQLSAKEEKFFDLSMSKVQANPGDTITIALDITNNPGIMATSFTLHYDTDVLEYVDYAKGIFSKDTSALHEGYVSFVFCGLADRTGDGTLYSFQFKVKETAAAGFSPITIKNIHPEKRGDSLIKAFANWDKDTLTPTLTSGGVTVGYTGSNCKHKFGEWETIHTAGCTAQGVHAHNCTICGQYEQENTPALGHNFETDWTIDREATELLSGLMTRHCMGAGCDEVTDRVNFTVRDAEGNGFLNEVGTVIPPDSWQPLKEIVIEREEAEKNEVQENEKKPPATEQPTETEKVPETIAPEISIDELPDADKLVDEAKKEDTVLVRWHTYLFGTDDSIGMLELLFNSHDGGILKLWRGLLSLLFGLL